MASNTIVQNGEWLIPIFGLVVALAAINSYRLRRKVSLIILTIILGGLIVVLASDKNSRTLYPIGSSGVTDESGPGEVVPFGIAIYVAGLGAIMAFMGSVAMYQVKAGGDEQVGAGRPRATKTCPDCAETILAEAHVCKRCGYRSPTTSLQGSRVAPASTRLPSWTICESPVRHCSGCCTSMAKGGVSIELGRVRSSVRSARLLRVRPDTRSTHKAQARGQVPDAENQGSRQVSMA